jgi:SAM-dependent methyltransferase
MLKRRTDREWQKFGEKDPYYGVISCDKFRSGQMDDSAKDDFFASGKAHIDYVIGTVRKTLAPDFAPRRALDFGCGVGRCLFPMAEMCDSAVGIDVSDAMLQEARAEADKRKIDNIELLQSDDSLGNVSGAFDLVHSYIVFQHIPPERGMKTIESLARLLSENGVGCLHFLYARQVPRASQWLGNLRKYVPLFHNLANLCFRKPFNEPLMEKNSYDMNRVMQVLYDNGCRQLHVTLQAGSPSYTAIVYFRKASDDVPYEDFFQQNA